MEKKLFDWISENLGDQYQIWGELPDQIGETPNANDNFKEFERRNCKYHISCCETILKTFPDETFIIVWKEDYKSQLKKIEREFPIPERDFEELTASINDAFYRLESFMNGKLTDYQYFGFNDAFTILFNEAHKTENFTFQHCKLIGKYWSLTEQIRVDMDQGDYENLEASENDEFIKDFNDLYYLNQDRLTDFCDFSTTDELEESNRKFSIADIIKDTAMRTTPRETITGTLTTILAEHGFFSLPKVNVHTDSNKAKLVKLLSTKKLPYIIAMFDFLNFTPHLQKEYYPNRKKLCFEIATWLGRDERAVKGNINVLIKNSKEDRDRYTAWQYKEAVQNDYQALK